MAYNQQENVVSGWARITLSYHKFTGSWAWLLHRVTGVGLTAYLFLHIYALTTLLKGEAEFAQEMALFTTPFFKFLEWLLFAFVIFHALNGIRIVLVDLGNGAKYHKPLLRWIYVIGIAGMIMMGMLIFQEELGLTHYASAAITQ